MFNRVAAGGQSGRLRTGSGAEATIRGIRYSTERVDSTLGWPMRIDAERTTGEKPMGSWGTGIAANDTVSDVRDFMLGRLKEGASLADASSRTIEHFKHLEDDTDDAPLLWQAIALVQWKYGKVADAVLMRVRNDIESERGLENWRDNPRDVAKRKAALEKFLSKLQIVNPKPAAPPKTIFRRAPFEEGDCLAVRTKDGRYTAALVLRVNNQNPEFGMNLVAGLNYLDDEPPNLAFFEERQWLFKRHGNWSGEPDLLWFLPVQFRETSKRIAIVGKTQIRKSDPKDAAGNAGWNSLGDQILYCRPAKL
jgi:hypothetical protein